MTNILIVEDETIVSMALKEMLENLNYTVIDSVISGEEAIKKAQELDVDIILMDIHLKGEIDGIQAAQFIRKERNIPIIFITAYADEETVKRAKVSEPYAYIIKPFNELSLRSNIEISLYKHQLELDIKDKQKHLEDVINSISDILFSIDANNQLKIWNKKAQQLFGYSEKEIVKKPLSDLSIFCDEGFSNFIKKIKMGKDFSQHFHIKMKTKEGTIRTIQINSSSIIRYNTNHSNELVIIGKDITSELSKMKKIQQGKSYLWYNREPESLYSTFFNLLRVELTGLFITRFISSKIEEMLADENISYYLLNKYESKNQSVIVNLEDFKNTIINFCKNQPAVIVIERIDFFLIDHPFNEVLQVLFEINDIVHKTNSILFLHVDPDLFDKKQFSLLDNEFFSLPKQEDQLYAVSEEFFEILAFLSNEHQRQRIVSLKTLKEQFDATYPTISKKIHELEEKHLIRVVKKGRSKTIEITTKGEEILKK